MSNTIEDKDILEYSLSSIKKINSLILELENISYNKKLSDDDEIKITKRQAELLLYLQDLPMPPSVRELARYLATTHQNVKTICLNLENKDLLEIRPDSRDGRKNRIKLTFKGEREAYNLSKALYSISEDISESFSSREIDELSRLLRKVEFSVSKVLQEENKNKNN